MAAWQRALIGLLGLLVLAALLFAPGQLGRREDDGDSDGDDARGG